MKIRRVRLIHWKAAEADDGIDRLRKAGYRVDHDDLDGPGNARAIAKSPPDVVVIDLSRLPSHGRETAMFLRQRKATRHIPVVFAGGDPGKVERTRKALPDAIYTPWSRIRSALKRALARPPVDPVVPPSVMAGYSDTPLPKKLGIKKGSVVALSGAPKGFETTLGRLPNGVTIRRRVRGRCDRVLWFVKRRKDLVRGVERMGGALSEKGGLWIAWPKKASGEATDLTQADVRRIGLASGLVDYKICAIDSTWSGLLFARRRGK
jgi:CheY-like chemotaxis protein